MRGPALPCEETLMPVSTVFWFIFPPAVLIAVAIIYFLAPKRRS